MVVSAVVVFVGKLAVATTTTNATTDAATTLLSIGHFKVSVRWVMALE